MSIPPGSKNNLYRYELDGIRALAIIAVFINHLNPFFLPSGYLGVDIFFTLSGFVISYSISNKVFKSKIEFVKDFYYRRFKRIAPSLIIYVVFISFLVSMFIHSGGTYFLTAISSIFGLSNLFLLKINSGYWGNDSLMNPFTNTWSLSLEEQFYFLFPFFTTLFVSKKENSIVFRTNIIVLITLLSLILYLLLYRSYGEISYYFTLTRIWQISLGIISFLVYKNLYTKNKRNKKSDIYISTISLISLISLFFLPKDYSYFAHILASALTFLLLIFLNTESFIKKLLSHKSLKKLSDLSYQIYLWHWGLIVLTRWTIGLNKYSIILILFFTFIISSYVHKYVEKPFIKRKFNYSFKKNTLILFVVSLIPFSLAKPLRNNFYLGQLSGNEKLYDLKSSRIISHGDSHADEIYKILRNNNSNSRYKLIKNVITGCKYYQIDLKKNKCSFQERKNNLLLKYSQDPNNIIILSANLNPILFANLKKEVNKLDLGNYNREEVSKLKEFLISLLKSSNANIIFKLPHTSVNAPNLPKPIRCIKRIYRPEINENCYVEPTKKIDYEKEYYEFKREFLAIAKNYSNFYIWDLSSVLCPGELCYPVTKNKQYMHDESHIFYTSPTLNNEIIISLNEILRTIDKKR